MGELEPSVSPSGPLTLHEALREARHDWLDLEHGALGTLIDMTVRPAKVMRAYLYERRRDYVRPLRYLLFSVAAQVAASYALLSSAFMQEQVQKQGEEVARAHWLLDNAAVLTLVLLPLIAGVLRLCFMRHGVRYVDALVVATYSQAQLNLFAAALVAPTVALTPPTFEEVADGEGYRRNNLLALRNTSSANYLGWCAITLPVGCDAAGMPVGLMLMGRGGTDAHLIEVARAVQAELGDAETLLGVAPRL